MLVQTQIAVRPRGTLPALIMVTNSDGTDAKVKAGWAGMTSIREHKDSGLVILPQPSSAFWM